MGEKDYLKPVDLPHVRLRFYLKTRSGDVEAFTIQLEYNLGMVDQYPDTWTPMARFDHNPSSPLGHDITKEGLHMDLIDAKNKKYDVKRGFPNIPLDEAPEYCENHLLDKVEELTEKFEQRGGLNGKYHPP